LLDADYFSAACNTVFPEITFFEFTLTDTRLTNQSKLVKSGKQHKTMGKNMLVSIGFHSFADWHVASRMAAAPL